MSRRSGPAITIPSRPTPTPPTMLTDTAVCSVREIFSSSPVIPRKRAIMTFTPTESPISTLIRRKIALVVLPTAARLLLPANRPTTMTSAALNNSCRIFAAISGRQKMISLSASEPWVMSILFLFISMMLLSYIIQFINISGKLCLIGTGEQSL